MKMKVHPRQSACHAQRQLQDHITGTALTTKDSNILSQLVHLAIWVSICGQGDKNAADQAAVDMMRKVLSTVQMNGVVVIGEGEKDVRAAPFFPCVGR